jgi:drug/metabolite transporter (DMT)-like permease
MESVMSLIQIVCAVMVPLLWGYQFVVIKVGIVEFPPLFFLGLRFLAMALLLVPFVKKPARQELSPVAAISVFLGGLNFGLFYVGLGLRKYFGRRISTRHALHHPVGLAAARGETVSRNV